MPNNFDFTDMVRLVSPARLTSYHTAFSVTNKAEVFGLYSWNLELSGSINSLLQLVEVALRNAINEAGKDCIVVTPHQLWFEQLPYHLITDENTAPSANGLKPLIKASQVRNFESGFAKAKKNAQRLLRKKLGANTTAVATLDQIISQTDFSVWEYIFDKSFYDGDASKGFLWPRGFLTAFKRLPHVSGKNQQFQQRDIIRRRVESIRMLRNRVAHNEPVWKDVEFSDCAAIIAGLTKKIAEIVELTYWISPVLNTFVRNSALMHRLNMLLCVHEMENATYHNGSLEMTSMDTLHDTLIKSGQYNRRVLISLRGLNGVIHARKHRFN
ncbi:hypothetical protein [Pantoea sp. USHLN256]|uniref:hypothetical protein n=1 Tax=Pantoea sp. USHLN256 TaxID=3081293 RepID=UPI00301B5E88